VIEKIKEIFRAMFPIPYNSYVAPKRPKDCNGSDVGCTIMCPHCETWTHQMTKEQHARADYEISEPVRENKAIYTCGSCQEKSEWFTGAPMPIIYSDVRKVE